MRKPLPPLSSLRSFEAVARQLSFSKAAEELHVTPGAVSQQIRALEELLGAKLFDRTRRWVALTDIAARMLPDVQAGLDSLAQACSSKAAQKGVVLPAGENLYEAHALELDGTPNRPTMLAHMLMLDHGGYRGG